jgi:hypothetical protein
MATWKHLFGGCCTVIACIGTTETDVLHCTSRKSTKATRLALTTGRLSHAFIRAHLRQLPHHGLSL